MTTDEGSLRIPRLPPLGHGWIGGPISILVGIIGRNENSVSSSLKDGKFRILLFKNYYIPPIHFTKSPNTKIRQFGL